MRRNKHQKGPTPQRGFGRVSDKDWKTIDRAAKRSGLNRTEWMLSVLLDAANKSRTLDGK
jgi:uncharacterized protein (DUF1778 family)